MKTTDLKKYRELAEEYECIELQLQKKEAHDAVLGDSGEPAFKQVSKQVTGYIHGMGTVSLLAEKAAVRKQMSEIEDFIAAIPVKIIREALELYCMDDKPRTWENIADILGYEGDLRRYCARYLSKIGKV